MEIIFTNLSDNPDLEKPKPASAFIPDWYKKTESYMGGIKKPAGDGTTTATIKRCIPVFDAITAGYIIETPADVFVSLRDGTQWFEWSGGLPINFHPVEQALLHPEKKEFSYPKWSNVWGIKTPKGYSTLFVQPFHRESVFTILPGIVDTDAYVNAVNFPFVVDDPTFEGLIPKGTPIAQIIPFKRESWNSKEGSKKEIKAVRKVLKTLEAKFFDRYKSVYWAKKQYK